MGDDQVAIRPEPNREQLRAVYKQLLRRVEVDSRAITRLERESRHRISSFRAGLRDLLDIAENPTVPCEKRLADVTEALKECLAK